MLWLICLHFLMLCFRPQISVSQFFGCGISMLCFFWSWNPDVVVYLSPQPRFHFHRENKKIMHNCFNYVAEKMFQLSKFMQHLMV